MIDEYEENMNLAEAAALLELEQFNKAQSVGLSD